LLEQRLSLCVGKPRVISGSMKPAATQFTVMLRLPSSRRAIFRHAGKPACGA